MTQTVFGKGTLYSFSNKDGMSFEVTDIGATLRSILVPDKDGNLCDVILGYQTPEEYAKENEFFGAIVGRNANRIGGASFELNGTTYKLTENNNGNNLHSGLDFFHTRMWQVKNIGDNGITFALQSPEGDQGYPGAVAIEVTYTLGEDNSLRIDYYGVPDKDTVLNMTNHSHFNLNGHASGDILGHQMWINADAFTTTDEKLIPTGEIRSVEGTPMDFRVKKCIGEGIDADYEPLCIATGYDHNWCLKNEGELAKVAELSSDVSGITMEVHTDLPGVQVYACNFLQEMTGKDGVTYRRRQAICFETQHYPDAIHHENFPSPVCKAGEAYRTTTVYKFI